MDINDGNAGIRVIDSNLKCRLDDIGNALVIHVSIRLEAELFGPPRAPERHHPRYRISNLIWSKPRRHKSGRLLGRAIGSWRCQALGCSRLPAPMMERVLFRREMLSPHFPYD